MKLIILGKANTPAAKSLYDGNICITADYGIFWIFQPIWTLKVWPGYITCEIGGNPKKSRPYWNHAGAE